MQRGHCCRWGRCKFILWGNPCNFGPPAEPHPQPNQSPAWEMSTFHCSLAGRCRWEWSEIIHYLRASFETFPLKVAFMQISPTHWNLGNYICCAKCITQFFHVSLSQWRAFRCRSKSCAVPISGRSLRCAAEGNCQGLPVECCILGKLPFLYWRKIFALYWLLLFLRKCHSVRL